MGSRLIVATLLLICFSFYHILHPCEGTLTIDPTTACIGDAVTVSCTLDVPNVATDNFLAIVTGFIVGNSDLSIPEASVDGTGTHGGVDLSKLTATATGGTTKSVQGSITLLSYTTGDNETRLGCGNEYYINGDTNNRASVTETLNIRQADVPSTPTNIVASLSSLSATNCTNTLVSWPSPASDRAIKTYYVYRNGNFIGNVTGTQYTDTNQLMVNTEYSYSVIANSCAGNSTGGELDNISIPAHRLDSISSVTYDNVTRSVNVSWILNTGTQSLMLAYSLTLVYKYTQSDNTYSLSNTISFSQSSDVTTHSVFITAPIYITNDTVVINIIACVTITQQCGSSFGGQPVCGDSSTSYVPIITTPTVLTTTLTLGSTTIPPSITTVKPTEANSQEPSLLLSALIILIIIILLLSVLSITIITLLVVVIVVMYRKIKHLQSLPKEPPHSYEYIDLNVSADIPSPPKDSAYYSTMQSVDTHNTSDTPSYANLK